ncbi:MAG: hypothetical protein LBH36_00325 [Candidatus Nomurabacteria bacterium]|jgi:hypothetical protein|nr:hypothetical protein [Candidatus Nomurabacteria bacterium]
MNKGKDVRFTDLSKKQREALNQFGNVLLSSTGYAKGYSAFMSEKGKVHCIKDFVITNLEAFEQSDISRKLDVFRGGGALKLVTNKGVCVYYDERHGWYRLPAGIALFNEGSDLVKTAIREGFHEELFPVIVENGEEILLVPLSTSFAQIDKKLKAFKQAFGVKLGIRIIDADFRVVDYFANYDNNCIEAVVELDLSNERVEYVAAVEDGWFRGGCFMPPVHAMKNGTIKGVYAPRQGFVPVNGQKLHPTLKYIM